MLSTSVMQNPFLITRLVFFALLVNINLLSIIFTSWNINATLTNGLPTHAAPVISLFGSCTTLLCIMLGLAELFFPAARTPRLLFECSWSGTLTVLQTAAAVSLSVHRHIIHNWSIEASWSLLIPTAWLCSIISLGYFSVLFITTIAHSYDNYEILSMSVYAVEWFQQAKVYDLGKASIVREPVEDPQLSGWNARPDVDAGKAPWAQNIRRGIDTPFKRPGYSGSTASSMTFFDPRLRPHSGTFAGRSIQKFRESRTISRSDCPLRYADCNSSQPSPLPHWLEHHDLPTPLPRHSEWI